MIITIIIIRPLLDPSRISLSLSYTASLIVNSQSTHNYDHDQAALESSPDLSKLTTSTANATSRKDFGGKTSVYSSGSSSQNNGGSMLATARAAEARVCMYVCMYIYEEGSMLAMPRVAEARVCMYVYVYTYIYIYIHMKRAAYLPWLAPAEARVCMYVYVYSYIYIYIHMKRAAYLPCLAPAEASGLCLSVCTCMYWDMYACIYIYTGIGVYRRKHLISPCIC